jgi:hypothetical protein
VLVEAEDVTLLLSILGDIRSDVDAIRRELVNGEEEDEPEDS